MTKQKNSENLKNDKTRNLNPDEPQTPNPKPQTPKPKIQNSKIAEIIIFGTKTVIVLIFHFKKNGKLEIFLWPHFLMYFFFLFSGYFYTKLLRIYCLSLVMKEKLVYCVPFAKCTSHHLLVTDFLAKSSSFFWREFIPQFHTVLYSPL